jgi:hypothetical protein
MSNIQNIMSHAEPEFATNIFKSDVLNRHVVLHARGGTSDQMRTVAACDACARSKIRCDQQTPCAPCQRARICCSFQRKQDRRGRWRQCSTETPSSNRSDSLIIGEPSTKPIASNQLSMSDFITENWVPDPDQAASTPRESLSIHLSPQRVPTSDDRSCSPLNQGLVHRGVWNSTGTSTEFAPARAASPSIVNLDNTCTLLTTNSFHCPNQPSILDAKLHLHYMSSVPAPLHASYHLKSNPTSTYLSTWRSHEPGSRSAY